MIQDDKCNDMRAAGSIEVAPAGYTHVAPPHMVAKKDAEGNLTQKTFTIDFRAPKAQRCQTITTCPRQMRSSTRWA